MGRRRPFAVEQVRRHAELSPAIRWRRLAMYGRQLAGAALGEMNGPQPDRTGVARWSLISFSAELADASATPPCLNSPDGERALDVFRAAGRGFAGASAAHRRTFAPALMCAAQLIDDLMKDGRP